ncbi:molybdenum cofactor biosysynthesis protein [Pseudonocardia sp. CNS-004]|nr:molybdenum cofactor biosysynthesis protein [Pseudonocardia sp. CNS-004]
MWRYPVKSMLGERLEEARLDAAGFTHDRGLALIDSTTGVVATAKHPRLWRALLTYSAAVRDGQVLVTSPAGWTRDATAAGVDELLSDALARPVRVAAERPDGATVERPDPEDVLDRGVDAVVPAATLEIGQGSPGTSFVDYAPVHLITSATLDAVGAEEVRYRPNLVVETPPGTPAFIENDWVGRTLHIGGVVGTHGTDGTTVLRIALPTPRCSVPTLEHGSLPRAPHAVRTVMANNRVEVAGFGVRPCAGCYAEVVQAGTVRVGDRVTLGE